MKLSYEIAPENLKTLEIKQILLDKEKFGALTFDQAYLPLHELRKMFVEFQELDYSSKLAPDEVQEIETYKNQLLDYVRRIHLIDPINDPTFNTNVRESLESEIISFCQRVSKVLRNNLVYLRQELSLKNQDQQSLAEAQKAASQAKKQSEEILSLLQSKLEELNSREQQLENKSGEFGAKVLGLHFGSETSDYSTVANKWFVASIIAYILLVLMVVGTAVYYSFFHVGGWGTLTWQEGAAKLFLFAALWYGLTFITRNFNVNSHLAAVNRHRAAVAKTLEDFLASNPSATGEMLKNGTEAMFRHVAIGFITKAEKDSGNPLLEVVNKVVNPRAD